MQAPAEPGYLSHREILPVVRGVALCILLSALDQTIVIPAVPRMAAELHGGPHLAWIVSAYLVAGTAATPILSRLADFHGRRRMLLPSILLFVLASLGCALARTLPQMLALRAVQGIAGAGLITLAQIAMADVIPPRERGRYQIYMSGMWGIASLGGPALGGLLTDFVSWRAIFWINLPLGAVAYLVCRRCLPPSRPAWPQNGGIDYAGAGLLLLSILSGLLLLSGGGHDFAWRSPTAALLAALALAGLAGLLRWEALAPAPILPLHIFAEQRVRGGLLLAFTNAFCTFGATLLLPLYFQYARHSGAAWSGLYATPFMLAFVVFSYAGGRISRAIGRTRPTMLIACALCLLGLLLLACMGGATPIPLSLFDMVLLGSGIGLLQPNITVAIQNAASRRDVGVATGCMLLFRAIGGAAGATLAGAAMLSYGFHAGFGICALAALAGMLIAAGMPDRGLGMAPG